MRAKLLISLAVSSLLGVFAWCCLRGGEASGLGGELFVETEYFEFGGDGIQNFKLPILNTTSDSICIASVVLPCTCTSITANYPKLISPGEQVYVPIGVHWGGKWGRKSLVVLVRFENARTAKYEVKLSRYPRLEFGTSEMSFRDADGSPQRIEIVGYAPTNSGGVSLDVPKISCDGFPADVSFDSVEVTRVGEAVRRVFIYSVSPKSFEGLDYGETHLIAQFGDMVAKAKLKWHFQQLAKCCPASLFFEHDELQLGVAQGTVEVECFESLGDVEFHAAEASRSGISVNFMKKSAKRSFQFEIAVDPERLPAGLFACDVKFLFKCNDRVFEMPFLVAVRNGVVEVPASLLMED